MAPTSDVSFDDMYGAGDDTFEAVNPGLGSDDEDERDSEHGALDGPLEELPVGISGPSLGRRARKRQTKGKGGKKASSKRHSKRNRWSARRSVRSGDDDGEGGRGHSMSEVTEHEMLVRGGSTLSGADWEDEVLNDDGADDLVSRKGKGWFSTSLVEGLGGGAMSLTVMLLLGVPALAVNLVPGVPYALGGQLLFLPLVAYVYLSFPVLVGSAFAFGLRKFGPLNGFPFRVGSLSVFPWIKDWHFHARVVVQDAAFGNPPGFPFENFLTCERLDFEGKVSFRHLRNLLLLRKEAVPLRKVPDFERFCFIDMNHVEVTNAMCNFQLYDGKFNINEFTRILADGEAQAVLRRDPFPNQLEVRVVSATNLQPHRLKRSCDPYVVVRCRRQVLKTHTQTSTTSPMWNETLKFHVEDASVVFEIAVFDRDAPEGNQASLIGHWCMTTKYLVTDPSFVWHYDEGFEAFPRGSRPDGATGFSGLVPLATKKWKKMGLCGQLQVEVLWRHVDEVENPYHPKKRYTALEQLSQQSAEDQLRFGDWSRFRDWLDHEPFDYDIRRFTVRGTKFYVQDLFRGHKGVAESRMVLSNSSVDGVDCVKLPFMEMRKQFRPKHGDEGITSYDVFIGFFIGLLTSAARSGRLGSALAQILSGGVWNFGNRFRNLLRGELDKALMPPIGPGQITSVAKMAKSGFQVLHQNVTQNRRNRAQFKVAVDARDTDFLSDDVEVAGHLDRCAVKVRGEVANADMAAMAKRRGTFKTKYFELKGDTLFYRKHRVVPKGVTYNLTYKLSLDCVYAAVFVKSANELLLNAQEESHVVRLREPTSGGDQGDRSLKTWIKHIRQHEIPFEEFP